MLWGSNQDTLGVLGTIKGGMLKSKSILAALAFLTVIGLAIASAPFAYAAPAHQASCAETYTVVAGDTLGTIAQAKLGAIDAYPQIVTATNAAAATDTSFKKIDDPNRIEVGQKLCIPAKGAVTPSATSGTPAAPAPAPALGGAAAGLYTNTGPAADASALVYLLTLDPNGGATMTQTYVGKSGFVSKGTWAQSGNTVTLTLSEQDGKPSNAVVVMTAEGDKLTTTQDSSKVFGDPGFVLTKTAADVVVLSGVYNISLPSNEQVDIFVALTLTPDLKATFNQSPKDQTPIIQTGTWTADGNKATVLLTKEGDKTIEKKYVFELKDKDMVAIEYDRLDWGTNGLTLLRAEGIGAASATAPAAPTAPAATAPAGTTATPVASTSGAFPGIYLSSSPAADASALLMMLELAADGNATLTNNYVGKGVVVETGTWSQTSDTTAVVTFTKQDDKNIQNVITFELNGDTLTATQYDQGLYGESGLQFWRATGSLTGHVTYTQKLALPDNAVVEVYLMDATATDAPPTTLSGISYTTNGKQVPLEFFVPYAGAKISESGNYVLTAFVSADGRLLFKNSNGVKVLTGGAPSTGIEIVVEPPAQ